MNCAFAISFLAFMILHILISMNGIYFMQTDQIIELFELFISYYVSHVCGIY